jgi:catechol 2,3-dioxygenase-like lactoylglutathione lyase family enzyme
MKKKNISSRRAAIPVRALDFVMYNTKNIRRARAFYQKLFGLKRGEEWNDFWSEFATEPLTFSLNGTDINGVPNGTGVGRLASR